MVWSRHPSTLRPCERLDAFLPPFWSRSNPIDILGDASPERFRQTLEVCFDGKDTDGVCVILAPQALTDPAVVAETLADTMKGRQYPVFACWMGGKSIEGALTILNKAGIPTYDTPERAIRAFLYMVEYARNMEALLEIPPKLTRDITVDFEKAGQMLARASADQFMAESDARNVLSAYGLPVIRTETARTEDEASRIGQDMGYPLVMKLLSPDISHKTEAGGVRLDLRSDADVRAAFAGIAASARRYKPDARIEGVTLQPLFANPDYEILLGAKRDVHFGPVILVRNGRYFHGSPQRPGLGPSPPEPAAGPAHDAGDPGLDPFQGYRNRPPADMERLEEMIIRLSQMLIDFPQIAELDMNPVLIKDGKAVAVDARILVSEPARPYPLHLVISPYPAEDESHLVTEEGARLFIRPVRPEDAPLFQRFFKVLSPETIYYRFFSHVKELSPQMLARFTQIDYDREIALGGPGRGFRQRADAGGGPDHR